MKKPCDNCGKKFERAKYSKAKLCDDCWHEKRYVWRKKPSKVFCKCGGLKFKSSKLCMKCFKKGKFNQIRNWGKKRQSNSKV